LEGKKKNQQGGRNEALLANSEWDNQLEIQAKVRRGNIKAKQNNLLGEKKLGAENARN